MAVSTVSGGPNFAADAGTSGGGQSGPGASARDTGNENAAPAAATSSPERGSATGNQTQAGNGPPNGGLAKVLAGGPEAGAGGEHGNENAASAAATSSPDQIAGQPKGKPGQNQSVENLSLPTWAVQLSKKTVADPNAAARLAAFKSLDDFVQAYLDGAAAADRVNTTEIPGDTATPETVQAFYERLGKPKEAGGYRFAKADPDFARFAFDANLTTAQAEALYAQGLARLEAMRKGIQANLARDIQGTDALLAKEYGERYDEAMALYQRGMGNNPKTGALSPVAQSLVDAGLAARPEIVRAFIELGRATSEGTATGGSAGAPQPDSVMTGRGLAYKDSYE